MAADGLITFDELRAKLAELEETRELAQRELEILEERQSRIREFERNADVLLKHYAGVALETLSEIVPEERHRIFKILRLRVRVQPSAILEVSGVLGGEGGLGRCEPNSASGASTTASASSTGGSGSLRSALPSPVTRSSNTATNKARSRTSNSATRTPT
jgi:hypothetical protein